MITLAVGRQAFVQGTGGVFEQLRRATFDLRRLGTLGAERRYCIGAFVGRDFGRGLARQVCQVPGFIALGRLGVGSEAGHKGGHVPALTLVELVGERWHLGTFDAQAEGVVQVEQAQLV
ncbi:hypothetical protein D3C80_1339670 [compost metagenome]